MKMKFTGWMASLFVCGLMSVETAHSRVITVGGESAKPALNSVVTETRTTVPCFLPDGPPPPENYLRMRKEFSWVTDMFNLQYDQPDCSKNTLGTRSKLQITLRFREPSIWAYEREKDKTENGEADWLRPDTIEGPEGQYAFFFYVASDDIDSTCYHSWEFEIRVRSRKKNRTVAAEAFYWHSEDPGENLVAGPFWTNMALSVTKAPVRVANVLYKNRGILYTGIPYSRSVDSLLIKATDPYGNEFLFDYEFRYDKLPRMEKSKDPSGQKVKRIEWEVPETPAPEAR